MINGLETANKYVFKKFAFYILLLILITFSLSLKAEIIDKIIINGNKRISDQTIILYGEIKIKEDINEQINEIFTALIQPTF